MTSTTNLLVPKQCDSSNNKQLSFPKKTTNKYKQPMWAQTDAASQQPYHGDITTVCKGMKLLQK